MARRLFEHREPPGNESAGKGRRRGGPPGLDPPKHAEDCIWAAAAETSVHEEAKPAGFFRPVRAGQRMVPGIFDGLKGLYEVSATCLPYWGINLIGSALWCWDAPWSGGIRILVEEE